MAKASNKERILCEGLKVVHEHGFANASVRDIVQAAGVPQGSFTNHFPSKEAFGLEIIDLYAQQGQALFDVTLRNPALTPLKRLEAYVDAAIGKFCEGKLRTGCLLGNFAAEASDHSDAMRARLAAEFAVVRAELAAVLRAAVAAGELPADFDCEGGATLIQSGLQGAHLIGKADHSTAALEQFKRVLFTKVLR
ncbi:MAG: TetR/AcrR family transcriptional regulator [Alphaproteobacteria bacterium]